MITKDKVRGLLKLEFPDDVSYNRFMELIARVFIRMMLFMKLHAFGRCTGTTCVDSTMIPVCHNVRRHFNKVFSGLAKSGKGTMGWSHGFKLHLLCNDSGEVITFCLTGANVDDWDERVWNVFAKVLYGKVFADRGHIRQELFGSLSGQGIHLVHRLKARMKNCLMPMWDKIMLRKRYIIEYIHELLKNKADLVYSKYRSIHNFIINPYAAFTVYCFFDNKPEALPVHVENERQLEFFHAKLSRTCVD
uniref:IS982 family transposase n=1 Tax=Prevotella dentasini TaxID=589537 RepID=UPI003570C71C